MKWTSNIDTEPLIVGWLLAHYGFSSPQQWIENSVKELLNLTNQKRPPIQLEPLFRLRRIVEYPKGFGFNGWEARFTLAHEIAHTFWFDLSTSPPRKTFPLLSKRISEAFCNRIAAEILMPKWMVKKCLPKNALMSEAHFDIQLFRKVVLELVKQFNVSPSAVTRRLVEDLNLWNLVLLGVGWCPKIWGKRVTTLGKLECKEPGFIIRVEESRKLEPEVNQDYAWRIAWYAKPSWALNELFIPSTGNPLIHLKIVEALHQSSEDIYCLESEERLSNFRVGNLTKLLKRIHGTRTQYPVSACFFARVTESEIGLPLPIAKRKCEEYYKRRRSKIAVCVPLASISKKERSTVV